MSAPISNERWLAIEHLFYLALELPPADRAAFLNSACNQDGELLAEVESLLAHENVTVKLLAEPVQQIASKMFGGPEQGDRIGSWRILRPLGQGGMGLVFLAARADEQYHQQAAIKLMSAALCASPAMVLRFRAERQILAQLEHPNIARLLDGGTRADGSAYLVLEYVEGLRLDEYCRSSALDLTARLQLFLQICDAVDYAHRHLVIHRDLKPANILVTPEGIPKLLDFGVARLMDPTILGFSVAQTRTEERLLTPEYTSPEQITGGAITTGTDVFGLGLLLYEILTGRRPFQAEGSDPLMLARAICEQDPLLPSAHDSQITKDLDCIVMMALRKEPSQRYTSAGQLASDVRAYLQGLPVTARSGTFRYTAGKFVRRHRTAVGAAALLIVVLAVFSLGMAVLAGRADRARIAAQREADFLSAMMVAARPEEAGDRVVTARDLLDGGAERVDRDLASTPEVRADMLEKIGLSYRSLGVLDKAVGFTKRAWKLNQQLYGAESLEAAGTMGAMGELLRDQGHFSEAESLERGTLAIREKKLGRDHLLTANTLADLGEILYLQDKNAQAQPLLLQSATVYRRLKTPELMTVDNYLAQLMERSGLETEAIQLLRESVVISRQAYGPNSRNYANCLHNLGGALIGIGNYVEAERLTSEAAEIRRKILPHDHPDRLYSLNNTTLLRVLRGDATRAKASADEAVSVALKAFGEVHPRSALVFRNQGRVQELSRDYEAAEATYRKALDILSKVKQRQGSSAASILLNLAELEIDRGDFATASQNANAALAIYERVGGRESGPVANALIAAGLAKELGGDAATAASLFRRALAIRGKQIGPQASLTVATQVRLGEALLAEGKAKEAEPLLRQAVYAFRQLTTPLLPWQRAEADSALGECLIAQKRLTEALPLISAKPVLHPQAWWSRMAARRLDAFQRAQQTGSRAL